MPVYFFRAKRPAGRGPGWLSFANSTLPVAFFLSIAYFPTNEKITALHGEDMAPETENSTITIDYETIRALALFQEQYDRLTHEIQQVRVQLESSPPLEPGSPGAEQRQEWRSWLQLQIKSKQHAREDLAKAMSNRNIIIEHLPE